MSGKKEFAAVFSGRKCATPDLVFYFIQNGKNPGRMGMVIGKKAFPGAVTRNKLKRRLRELFRQFEESVKGFDIVIVAKKGRRLPAYGKLESQFGKLAEVLSN